MAHTTMQRLRAPGTPRIAAYLLTLLSHEIKRWEGKKPPFRDFHHSELAEECGCSVRTIIRAVQWLHANGKLHVERTGRRNRYHLHAPVEKVEAPLVLLVDNPRSDTSVTSDVTLLSPIEPDENLSNIVSDDTSEASAPSQKELTKERGFGGGVSPRPSRAKGDTPTSSKASITSQELDELFSNVGAGEAAAPLGGAAPTRVTARMDDDITDAIVGTVASENQEPPKREKATDTEPEHPTDTGETFIEWITGGATGPKADELSDEELARAKRIEDGYRKFQAQARDAGGEFADIPDNYGRDTLEKRGKARAFAEQRRRRMKHAPVHERQLEQH